MTGSIGFVDAVAVTVVVLVSLAVRRVAWVAMDYRYHRAKGMSKGDAWARARHP